MLRLRELAPYALLPALCWSASALRAQEQESRTITIPRTLHPPELDGLLEEQGEGREHDSGRGTFGEGTLSPTWAPRAPGGERRPTGTRAADRGSLGVPVTTFRQREPRDGAPASRETTAWLSYDDQNLYVVFACEDDPAQVRASVARREDITSDDYVAVYLDTFRDGKRSYVFMVNPRGVQRDGILTEGQDEDFNFDAVWSSEGRLTDEGWVVRITIPFRSLRFPRAPVQTWGLAVGRGIQRNDERSYWPYITERLASFVPQFAEARGLADISPGLNLQLDPYTTFARARVLDDDADVPAFRSLDDERFGADAKLVLRDALTLDATINPDFSQVETDDPQVTVNRRFEVYYPEKRPFFLENAGYFQTPVNLFFSRRIVDPQGGLRLTGKAGGWTVGAMVMRDRAPAEATWGEVPAGRAARVGAVRVQHELGEESTLGILATDRALAGRSNRVLSADARLRLGDVWSFTGQFARSFDHDAEGRYASGTAAHAQWERDGRHFGYEGEYGLFTRSFNAPLAFVERVAVRELQQEASYAWRPDSGPVVEWGPSLAAEWVWDPSGALLDRELSGLFEVSLVASTSLEIEHARLFEMYDDFAFHPSITAVSVGTEWLKWLSLDVSHEWGTAVNHDPADGLDPFLASAAETEVELTMRPTASLRWDQAFITSGLEAGNGRDLVTERMHRTKVNYQFSRFLSIRAIVDRKTEVADTTLFDGEGFEGRWSFDLLLAYVPRPGTAVYVGYTDRLEGITFRRGPEPRIEASRRDHTSTARQLFVKLSYLVPL